MNANPSQTPTTLRTLQIGDDWPEDRQGGLNRYFVELLRHLPETGTDAHGLVVGSERVRLASHGKVTAFAKGQDPIWQRFQGLRKEARHVLETSQTDLIVSHFALYAAPLAGIAKETPRVVHFHGPWAAESHTEGSIGYRTKAKAALERYVYKRAERLIVLSRAFHDELARRYGVPEAKIRIISGGIDTQRFNMDVTRDAARKQLAWPTDRRIILTVRRLVRRMGLEHLIEAMRSVVGRHPDVLLLLGGSGPMAAELQQRITEARLEQHIRLLGRIEEADLPVAYRAADLSVVPSQALEGFGLITLESLASGTPVLVTPVGGLPEIVRPFAEHCIFADVTASEMALVLTEFLDGSRSLPSAEACRAYATENFSWSHIAMKVRAVYDEAVGTRPA